MAQINHCIEVERPSKLVVILHGYSSGTESIMGLVGLAQQTFPDADIYYPDLPLRRWYCTMPMEAMTNAVFQWLDQRCSEIPYTDIILVGHSCGGLLARKLVLAAWGEADDVTPACARPWAGSISRLVFLAAINRGWSISSALSRFDSLLWSGGALINSTLFGGKATIFQLQKGTPFLVATRLQWLKLMRDVPEARVTVVQLLGTVDDLVSPDDSVDYVADFALRHGDQQLHFFMLELPRTGHLNATQVSDPESAVERERAGLIRIAMHADEATLIANGHAIRREHLEDTLPPPPDAEVTDVVFVMHGIRDRGFWTKKIARKIRELGGDKVRCQTRSYGYFPMAPFLFRSYRLDKVRWFMDAVTEARSMFPDAAFSFVGHSNGTYLLAAALRHYRGISFKSVVFAGSVVRRDFDWPSLMRHDAGRPPRVQRLWNYVATQDWVVAIFPKGLQPLRYFDLGSAGHDGFADALSVAGLHEVRFVKGTHAAGIQETQWDEIARFILHGTPPDIQNTDYSQRRSRFVSFLGHLSSPIVGVVSIALIAIIATLFYFSITAATGLSGSMFMAGLALFLLFALAILTWV